MLTKNTPAFFCCALILLAMQACSNRQENNQINKEEWMPLFNGKDFAGWDIKIKGHPLNENYKNTFRAEDSMLRVSYSGYQKFNNQFGHIFTHIPYSYYKLKLQYRFTGNYVPDAPGYDDGNSGILLHSESAESMELNQFYPSSLEFMLLCGNRADGIPTASVCGLGTFFSYNGKPNTGHIIKSASKTHYKDEWVSAVAEVYGDSLIRHIINGDTVLTYANINTGEGFAAGTPTWVAFSHISDSIEWHKKTGKPLKEGYIALQAESQPIDFRKIELLNLVGCTDKKAKNYKGYYIKPDNSKCKY